MSATSLYFIFLTWLMTITGQLLTTEYLNIKLPIANSCPVPFYDGHDSIYLFGGCSQESYNDILKFSITSETLEKVGSLPGPAIRGTLQSDNFIRIFYVGGGSPTSTDVFKYDIPSNISTLVANLPYDVRYGVSVKYDSTSDTVFLLGGVGQRNELWSFDMATLTSNPLTNLTFSVTGGTSVRVGNKAYVFDDTYPNANRKALELDLDTYDMQPVGNSTLPLFNGYPSSIWDGTHVYVIGGYQNNSGATDGLYQFDPATNETKFIPVRYFPVEDIRYFYYAPASIFVPSKNRIYFFGGQSVNATADEYIRHDEIFYIDLSALGEPMPCSATTSSSSSTDCFTCKNRPNDFYPHPTDCSLFIRCQNEELIIFSCPPDLHYDPLWKNCNLPEVECGMSCVDKPDGSYPHPDDCSLYIICQSESANVFKCPPPLLFDPEELQCGWNVTCPTS